jgi:hypothetical protein
MYNRLKFHWPTSIKYEHSLRLKGIVAYVKLLYCLFDLLANLDGVLSRGSSECSLSMIIIT